MNAFYYGLNITMCKLSAHVAFDKTTNGQTDIKQEMWKTLLSKLMIAWYIITWKTKRINKMQSGGYTKSETEKAAIIQKKKSKHTTV